MNAKQFGLLSNYGITKSKPKNGNLVEVLYKTVLIEGLPVKLIRRTTVLEANKPFSLLVTLKKNYILKGYLATNLKITY